MGAFGGAGAGPIRHQSRSACSEAYSPEHCFYFPYIPLPWRAYSTDGSEPWFVDCTQFDCTNLLTAATNLTSGVTAYGVELARDLSTGETTLRPDGATDVVATPSGFEPGVPPENASAWHWYQQLVACPDCYGIEGEVPPPTLILHVFLANINDYGVYAAYESNLEAEAAAEAATTASAMSFGGSFMSMDDEEGDGSDPCSITNLLQAFFVTGITQSVNHATSITFQSCQTFRYLISSADSLSTNTQWVPQAYVWGATNVSSTTWTDSSTTNNDGNTISQRFYRVERLLGSPIAAGGESSVAIKQDGTLWTWGNSDGDLGDGLDSAITGPDSHYVELYLPYPGDVANAAACGIQTITNATAVAAGGDDYTVIVDATGTVWTCGENSEGQLGNGMGPDNLLYPVPAPISGIGNVVSVAAGFQHTLALRADETVWAWGFDNFWVAEGNDNGASGALGAGYAVGSTNSPIQTTNLTQIVAIAAGDAFSLALDTSGRVWGWGDNEYGEIGNGVASGVGFNGTNTPILVQGVSNVIAIAAGASASSGDINITGGGHSIALTADKRVWTWGDNEFGELGRGTLTYDPTPRVVTALTNQYVVAIAGGLGFTLAVTSNGHVYAWGDNTFGQLGTNTSAVALTNSPMLVSGISNAVSVSAPRSDDGICNVMSPFAFCTYYSGGHDQYLGGVHVVAMTLDQGTNHYWGWGDNTYGQVGNGMNGGATNQVSQYSPAGPLQFCTRCQREVQLGTMGTFQAQCNGTLYLYFNTDNFSGYNAVAGGGSYSATVNDSNVAVYATNYLGVAVGTVTVGNVYTFSASGYCVYDYGGNLVDPDGRDSGTSNQVDCSFSYLNVTNSVCPSERCFTLVARYNEPKPLHPTIIWLCGPLPVILCRRERKSAMKAKLRALPLVCLIVLTVCATSTRSQTVVNFDDLSASPGGTFIPTSYQGLSWSNFAVLNEFLQLNNSGTNGYYYGMVSPSNVAFNAGGSPAEIDAHGTNFDFLTTYFTGAWNSNLNIEVQGFRSGTLLYNTTVVVSATSRTLFTFDYMDIDRLYFNSYGGQPAFTPVPEYQFVMDNMAIDFIPEPSSLLLTGLGALALGAFVRRKRV